MTLPCCVIEFFAFASCAFNWPVQVTGLAVSARHPYMFSCGLDKMVKCWDLEQNKVRGMSYAQTLRSVCADLGAFLPNLHPCLLKAVF